MLLQVLGNAKGVVAAIISVLIFKNPVTVQGGVGYFVTVLGVVLYTQARPLQPNTHTLATGPEPSMAPECDWLQGLRLAVAYRRPTTKGVGGSL